MYSNTSYTYVFNIGKDRASYIKSVTNASVPVSSEITNSSKGYSTLYGHSYFISGYATVSLTYNNGELTKVDKVSVRTSESYGYLATDSANGDLEPFTPTKNNHPTNKKYVDDLIKETTSNVYTVYWDGNKTNLSFFQDIVDKHNNGKDVLIVTRAYSGARPTIIFFYADTELSNNKYILTSIIDNTRTMTFVDKAYNQLQLVQSRLDITITDNIVSKIDYTLTAGKSFDYLDATSPNTNIIYTPTLDNHPATKKYVDDNIIKARLDGTTLYLTNDGTEP